MSDEKAVNILATIHPDQFVCREEELARLWTHAHNKNPVGFSLLSAPGAGTTELLLQTFDELFRGFGDIIPIYLEMKYSDLKPGEAARRLLLDFFTQLIAFRLRDASLMNFTPDLQELIELTPESDRDWIPRILENAHTKIDSDVEQSNLRSLLSFPARAAAHGQRVFFMLDHIHYAGMMTDGDAFVATIREMCVRSDIPHVFAGPRRFLNEMPATESMLLNRFDFRESGAVAEVMASRFDVGLNEQTRDLIGVQVGGNLKYMSSLFSAAADRREDFDSFRSVERVYAEGIFGGRISRSFDSILRLIFSDAERTTVIGLLLDGLNSVTSRIPIANWRDLLKEKAVRFESGMQFLNSNEFVNVSAGFVSSEIADRVLSDYIIGAARLEIAGESRALVVGESMTAYLKRAPQLLGRIYRHTAAVGLKDLLNEFNCQEIAAGSIDFQRFKDQLKGLRDADVQTALDASVDRINLPLIVFTASTAAFYPRIAELIDDDHSAIGLGFVESNYHNEIVWLTAELECKLEADRELTEFWCDRLEMVAISCGFREYKIWLIAPEGFSDEAIEVLRKRNAYGSCRRQVELLSRQLKGGADESLKYAVEEYEIIVPMDHDTEMIAAHTVEEIARKHNFPPKMINQIKTALVEACINAAEHSLSPDRRIFQKFAVSDDRITVTVSNRGIRLLDKTAEEAVPVESRRGWGLRLMRGLMDEVKIENVDDGTRISMVKYLRDAQVRE
ncbi:MAG: ATP-binding protein [Acidobacteriota bacterium]